MSDQEFAIKMILTAIGCIVSCACLYSGMTGIQNCRWRSDKNKRIIKGILLIVLSLIIVFIAVPCILWLF